MTGCFIQSRFGSRGNFEVVLPAKGGGLVHFSRDNDAGGWSGPAAFGNAAAAVSGASLIQSNTGTLEVVAVVGGQLFHFWRDSGPAFRWSDPGDLIAGNVTGIPGLIQSKFGSNGNFEAVVPSANGGLVHFSRDNDAGGFPWSGPTVFGQKSLGPVAGACVIQSNFGNPPGNLEVIAIQDAGGQFAHLWRDSGPAFTWSDPLFVPAQIFGGGPGLIQSRFGSRGNFEVVVPTDLAFGVTHFYRNNDDPALPWNYTADFGNDGTTQYFATSLIESNYGSPGNLEVVAAADVWAQVNHFWRDSGPTYRWSASDPVF